ncbi:hypothetical protein D8862_09130 [Streptococcus oralis]|uniref:Uncharacterized protein n=1 Tax=Streptococcus oralis TaxID=1303 RepID=A0A428BJC8_STROR|nr:hypothetical protein D8862_09130 [Streptococcus oralis]
MKNIFYFLDKIYKNRKRVIALGLLIQFGFVVLKGILSIISSQ